MTPETEIETITKRLGEELTDCLWIVIQIKHNEQIEAATKQSMMNEEEENTAAEVPIDWRQTRRSHHTMIGLASSVGAEKKKPQPNPRKYPIHSAARLAR